MVTGFEEKNTTHVQILAYPQLWRRDFCTPHSSNWFFCGPVFFCNAYFQHLHSVEQPSWSLSQSFCVFALETKEKLKQLEDHRQKLEANRSDIALDVGCSYMRITVAGKPQESRCPGLILRNKAIQALTQASKLKLYAAISL